MKKTALALASALLLVAACDSSSTDSAANGGAGANGSGVSTAPGTQGDLATNIGDRVFFETNSSVVNGDGQATIERQAGWLKQYEDVNVVIEGHADERGTREFNLALGERRATATKNYLVSQGIAASRVSTISYGKERPAVVGNDESSWSQNRRAVTVIAN